MTDNEIVKALKEILEIMLTMGDLQKSATISNALDLINRQKAEIESLERRLHNAQLIQKETYKLFGKEQQLRRLTFSEDFIKNEAVKAFEERLFSLFPEDKNFTTISRFTVKQNCKKKMVGDKQ